MSIELFYGFPLSTIVYFPTIGRRMTGNANGLKVQKFKLVISLNLQNLDETVNTGFAKCVITPYVANVTKYST